MRFLCTATHRRTTVQFTVEAETIEVATKSAKIKAIKALELNTDNGDELSSIIVQEISNNGNIFPI